MPLFKNDKRNHFKMRLEQVQAQIWDLEFLREKLRKLREGIRKEYDRLKEKTEIMKNQLAGTSDENVKKQIQAEIDRFAPDLEQLLKQIGGLDAQIEQENNPQSVVSKIAALNTTRAMLKAYMNSL